MKDVLTWLDASPDNKLVFILGMVFCLAVLYVFGRGAFTFLKWLDGSEPIAASSLKKFKKAFDNFVIAANEALEKASRRIDNQGSEVATLKRSIEDLGIEVSTLRSEVEVLKQYPKNDLRKIDVEQLPS